MPKIKTNRAAAKRFRKTASGKFKARPRLQEPHPHEEERPSGNAVFVPPTSCAKKTPVVSRACCRTHKGDDPWHV